MIFGDAIKLRARAAARPAAAVLARADVSPNLLTVVGFGLSLGVAAVLATGALQLGGVLLLFAGAFDMLDGAVARLTGRMTRFGAFLDSTLDRYSEAALLIGLLIPFLQAGETLPVVLIAVALAGSLLVSYTRARAEGLGLTAEVGLLERPERLVLLALGLIAGQPVLALWALALLANFTAVQRILHVWRLCVADRREAGGSGVSPEKIP